MPRRASLETRLPRRAPTAALSGPSGEFVRLRTIKWSETRLFHPLYLSKVCPTLYCAKDGSIPAEARPTSVLGTHEDATEGDHMGHVGPGEVGLGRLQDTQLG